MKWILYDGFRTIEISIEPDFRAIADVSFPDEDAAIAYLRPFLSDSVNLETIRSFMAERRALREASRAGDGQLIEQFASQVAHGRIAIGNPSKTTARAGGAAGEAVAEPAKELETARKDKRAEPAPAPAPVVENAIRITSIEAGNFAPETESLEVAYSISGPLDQVRAVYFVVETDAQPPVRLSYKKVDPPYEASGTYVWRGEVSSGPGGFVTLRSSPYVLKFSLQEKSGAERKSNTKAVEVLAHSIETFVDDPGAGLLNDAQRSAVLALRDELATNGGKGRLMLNSPVFKTRSSEMNDDASYMEYRRAHKQGISVPIYARIWVKGKDGSRQRSAAAMGGARVLWNVELQTADEQRDSLDERNVQDDASDFIDNVSAYAESASEPVGRAAHMHFGGMHAPWADRTAREKHWMQLESRWAGVEVADRGWSAITRCRTDADREFDSGVFFVGGRMAGDVHYITAYLEGADTLDAADDAMLEGLPDEHVSDVLTLENWRRVDVVKNYKIGASTVDLDIPALNLEYNKAAMSIDLKPGVAVEDVQSQWAGHYRDVIAEMSTRNEFVKHAALDDPQLYPVRFRTFEEYDRQTVAEAGRLPRLWQRLRSFFGAGDVEAYRNECDNHAYQIYVAVVKRFPLEDDGLTFFKFGADGDHNRWADSFTAGIAPAISGYTGRNKAVFFVFKQEAATLTLIHEVGHLLFLSHAPGHFNPGSQPGGYQPEAHNAQEICIMSYHDLKQHLCGLCLLKLSGWDYTRIDKDGNIT